MRQQPASAALAFHAAIMEIGGGMTASIRTHRGAIVAVRTWAGLTGSAGTRPLTVHDCGSSATTGPRNPPHGCAIPGICRMPGSSARRVASLDPGPGWDQNEITNESFDGWLTGWILEF